MYKSVNSLKPEKMKRIAILLWLSMCIGQLSADNYKVLVVNDASLKFSNGKVVRVGDVFSDVKEINWEKEKQAVKVLNLTTRKPMLFVGKEWIKKSGVGVLFNDKQLSAHASGDEPTIYDKLRTVFADEYNLLDSVEVETDMDLSGGNHFQATYKYGDATITKQLTQKDKTVIFDRSLFTIDGKELEPKDVILSIDYVDGATGLIIFVKDNISLVVFPDAL